MALQEKFIKRGFMLMELENFIKDRFERAGFSHIDIERVPLGTRIVIFAERPGLIIGKGGERVAKLTGLIEKKFAIENPQIDIQPVENADLDPEIVARRIADTLERGVNYKRVCNMTIRRIMDAGAVGCYIRVAGKLGGEKSRFEKFSAGYIKHCGEPARKLVMIGHARALPKAGAIGVLVKIVPNTPEVVDILGYSEKALALRAASLQEADEGIIEENVSARKLEEEKKRSKEEQKNAEETGTQDANSKNGQEVKETSKESKKNKEEKSE